MSEYKTDTEMTAFLASGLHGMSNREERELFVLGVMAMQNNQVLQELERIRVVLERRQ